MDSNGTSIPMQLSYSARVSAKYRPNMVVKQEKKRAFSPTYTASNRRR